MPPTCVPLRRWAAFYVIDPENIAPWSNVKEQKNPPQTGKSVL